MIGTHNFIRFMQDAPIFSVEDDSAPGSFDSQLNNVNFSVDLPNLLSVNQLMESVCSLFIA
jgi:hypothetical protein